MDKESRKIRNQEILRLHNLGISYNLIAKEVGLSKTAVHKIIHGVIDNVVLEAEVKINVHSLREIAIYLQGIKDGKGNLLPLGNIVLEDLWEAISILNKKSTENDFSAKDMVEYALYCLESKTDKNQVVANLKNFCKDNNLK